MPNPSTHISDAPGLLLVVLDVEDHILRSRLDQSAKPVHESHKLACEDIVRLHTWHRSALELSRDELVDEPCNHLEDQKLGRIRTLRRTAADVVLARQRRLDNTLDVELFRM
jgi:hypothetical protein